MLLGRPDDVEYYIFCLKMHLCCEIPANIILRQGKDLICVILKKRFLYYANWHFLARDSIFYSNTVLKIYYHFTNQLIYKYKDTEREI